MTSPVGCPKKLEVVEVAEVAGSVKNVEPGVGDGEKGEVVPSGLEVEVSFDLVERYQPFFSSKF